MTPIPEGLRLNQDHSDAGHTVPAPGPDTHTVPAPDHPADAAHPPDGGHSVDAAHTETHGANHAHTEDHEAVTTSSSDDDQLRLLRESLNTTSPAIRSTLTHGQKKEGSSKWGLISAGWGSALGLYEKATPLVKATTGAIAAGGLTAIGDTIGWLSGSEKSAGAHAAKIFRRGKGLFGRIRHFIETPARFLMQRSLNNTKDLQAAQDILDNPGNLPAIGTDHIRKVARRLAGHFKFAGDMHNATDLEGRRTWKRSFLEKMDNLLTGGEYAERLRRILAERRIEDARRDGRVIDANRTALLDGVEREEMQDSVNRWDRVTHAVNIIKHSAAMSLVAAVVSVAPAAFEFAKTKAIALKGSVESWWASPSTRLQRGLTQASIIKKYGIPGGYFWQYPVFEPIKSVGTWAYNKVIMPVASLLPFK